MAIFERHSYDPTAFMSGQMISKIWLCEELENIWGSHELEMYAANPATIWIYGGWYATTNFLLRARGNLPIRNCLTFDVDPEATRGALILNETYIFLEQFNAITQDINQIEHPSFGGKPNIIINTSCEHIEDNTWFDRIPTGTLVVLQSNDMPHEDHHANRTSVDDMIALYPLSDLLFSGEKHFEYADWSFNRFMLIGFK